MIKYETVLQALEAASAIAGKNNPIEVGVKFHDAMISFHEKLGFQPGTNKMHLVAGILGQWNGHQIYEMRDSNSFSFDESLPQAIREAGEVPTFEVASMGISIPSRPSGTKKPDTNKRGPTVVILSDVTKTVLKGDTGTLLELLQSKEPHATLANIDWHGISDKGNGVIVTVPACQLAVPGLVTHYLTMSPYRHVNALKRLLLAFKATTPEGKAALAKDVQDAKDVKECLCGLDAHGVECPTHDKPVEYARRPGYKLCQKHKQEYIQYCSCCAVETHETIVSCVEEDLENLRIATQHYKLCCDGERNVGSILESYDRIAETFRARLNNGVPPYATEETPKPDLQKKGPEIKTLAMARHILNHYSDSKADLLCLVKRLEEWKGASESCECKAFSKGLHDIHRSCETAALNGVSIKLPTMKFCPWCGGTLKNFSKGKHESSKS